MIKHQKLRNRRMRSEMLETIWKNQLQKAPPRPALHRGVAKRALRCDLVGLAIGMVQRCIATLKWKRSFEIALIHCVLTLPKRSSVEQSRPRLPNYPVPGSRFQLLPRSWFLCPDALARWSHWRGGGRVLCRERR